MLSVVINTYNEEANIAACITSVKSIADEVVVCDMYSTDQTVSIARSLGAKIFMHKKEKVVEPARNAAISFASGPWILVLDADERMVPKTAAKIAESMKGPYDSISLWSKNYYFGAYMEHGGFYYEVNRCFKKDVYLRSYSEEETKTHMNFSNILDHSTTPLHLSNEYYYEHLAYPTIEKYVVKTIGYYAAVEAGEAYGSGARFSMWKLLLSPWRTFIQKYILAKGYKDGTRGFILCALFAFYDFTKSANLWMLQDQRKKS